MTPARLIRFLVPLALSCAGAIPTPTPLPAPPPGVPTDDPTARYGLPWTREIRWGSVVSIDDFAGASTGARLAAAQAALGKRGGGVVFFPAGVYRFDADIALESGVVLRGAEPSGALDARRPEYMPGTRFEFPRYLPSFAGSGTPSATAFKGIHVADAATTSNVGVVHIALDRVHVGFGETADHRAGRNRLVYGCLITGAAVAAGDIPDHAAGQHGWQRFTDRQHAAVRVFASENLLVANNRLAPSTGSNFVMKGYVLPGKDKQPFVPEAGVEFDYDNRPGITANNHVLGGEGGSLPDGTPQTHPHGFRRGLVISDNYVFSTGRTAIAFAGDGVVCAGNVVRFKKGVVRPTTTGKNVTSASSTNDNRAIQMRGWRWRVESNDYDVAPNLAADGVQHMNDGEGLMHEDHANSTVKDSQVLYNRGNAYISIYKTGGIDGLVVQGNDVRTAGGIAAIFVVANRNASKHPCRGVQILGNITAGGGIRLACDPSERNAIKDNQHVGPGDKIQLQANAEAEGNEGYMMVAEK